MCLHHVFVKEKQFKSCGVNTLCVCHQESSLKVVVSVGRVYQLESSLKVAVSMHHVFVDKKVV